MKKKLSSFYYKKSGRWWDLQKGIRNTTFQKHVLSKPTCCLLLFVVASIFVCLCMYICNYSLPVLMYYSFVFIVKCYSVVSHVLKPFIVSFYAYFFIYIFNSSLPVFAYCSLCLLLCAILLSLIYSRFLL